MLLQYSQSSASAALDISSIRRSALALESSGVRSVRLPSRSPNLNAYAERFVRSIKSECLAQVIPIGEAHLRRAVREYVEHYHGERNQR
jgi:putative transposase